MAYITPSQKPNREWLWLLLALVLVGGVTVPLWQLASPAEKSPEYWARWDRADRASCCSRPRAIAVLSLLRLGRVHPPQPLSRSVCGNARAFGLDLLPTDEGARNPARGRPAVGPQGRGGDPAAAVHPRAR